MAKHARHDDDVAPHPVAAAYWTARAAGLGPADGYRAAVDEWLLLHPGDDPRRAAQKAVALVAQARTTASDLPIGARELACLGLQRPRSPPRRAAGSR